MATRKVFSDETGRELSYHLIQDRLRISILTSDKVIDESTTITLDNEDALQFIAELNKIRRLISNK